MTKKHCYVTDVCDAIEKLADALDPERTKPFGGDILDLLEWAEKDALELRQQLAEAEASERFAHSMLANRIVECDQLRKQVTPLREVLAHIHRCIPIGGFAQIHWDSATWVQIDEALAATEPEKIDDDP